MIRADRFSLSSLLRLVGVMFERFKSLTLAMLLSASLCGCRGPTELFSWVDRNCFIADWTNDHSCLSCRYTANAGSGPTISKVRPPIPAPNEEPNSADNPQQTLEQSK